MVRQLWLLRHAEAEPHGMVPDGERALTERGERQAHAAGAAIARIGVSFERILTSPKVRARHTAELAGTHLSAEQRELLETYPPLAGGFDGAQALDALAGVSSHGHLMLVGHEPDLSGIAGDLTGVRLDMKKGGIAVVRLDGTAGELVLVLRPREIVLIADGAVSGA